MTRAKLRPGIRTAVLAALLTSLLGGASADAAFPGTNGRIAFSQGDLIPPIGGEPSDLSAHSQVFTIDPDGGGLTQLTNVAGDQAAAAPDWSADGEQIVYESNESGAFQIWVMNANGTGQTQLTAEQSGFEDFQPSWSPDGERILFSHCAEPLDGFISYCDIDVMNANGTGVETLLSEGHWTNIRPEFSPDGNRIAFSSDKGGFMSAVWVMNADGSSPERLTTARMRAFWPDWAPNGKRILFSDHCCVPNSNLWTVRPGGGGLKQVTHVHESDLGFASNSPNGKRILTLFPLQTRHADGSHPRVVTDQDEFLLSDWGPGA